MPSGPEEVVILLSRGSLIQFLITEHLHVVTLSMKIECVELENVFSSNILGGK